MEDLTAIGEAAARRLEIVLTDIDDTLTTEGRLTASAYGALETLQILGLRVVPITGRPAGWCDLIARFWPVNGVVGENGAFYFAYDREKRTMRRHYSASEAERIANRGRLEAIAREVLETIPGAAISADQPFRVADLAVDFREDVPPLANEAIQHIVAIFQKAGAEAKVSSIHVNGWFGKYDKLSMTRTLLRQEFELDLDDMKDRVLFVGDSPNDEPMFRFFPFSVGVANIKDAMRWISHPPSFITRRRSGDGFVEVAEYIAAAHGGTRY